MKSKRMVIFVFIIVSIILVFMMIMQNISLNNEIQMYKSFWNIKLPSKTKCVYKWDNQDSFHGEGIRYSRYQLLENDTSLLTDYDYTQNNELEKSVINLMNDCGIPDKQKIDFNSTYCWKYIQREQDSLLIIYSLNIKSLFLIQDTA